MLLPDNIKNQGFSIDNVSTADLNCYLNILRICYERYVDEYFGGWIENIQLKMNTDAFSDMMNETVFKKILLNDEIVGFFAYDEQSDKIDGTSIQMIEIAQNKGVGSFYLAHITSLSRKTNKAIFLKVFRSNPAMDLYRRFGFRVSNETPTHYLMRYDPIESQHIMAL